MELEVTIGSLKAHSFRAWGFRVLGFRVLGFEVFCGFRVQGQGSYYKMSKLDPPTTTCIRTFVHTLEP